MTEDNVTKTSKAQAIKVPSAFNNRYEAIDVVEEGNYKAQSQLRKAIYMYHTLISSLPRPSQIEKKRQRAEVRSEDVIIEILKRPRNARMSPIEGCHQDFE
jgi:hypothetical protein